MIYTAPGYLTKMKLNHRKEISTKSPLL